MAAGSAGQDSAGLLEAGLVGAARVCSGDCPLCRRQNVGSRRPQAGQCTQSGHCECDQVSPCPGAGSTAHSSVRWKTGSRLAARGWCSGWPRSPCPRGPGRADACSRRAASRGGSTHARCRLCWRSASLRLSVSFSCRLHCQQTLYHASSCPIYL